MNENQNNNFSFPASDTHKGVSPIVIAGALVGTVAVLGAIVYYIYYGMTHTPSMDTTGMEESAPVVEGELDMMDTEPAAEISLEEKYRILEELVASSTSTPMTVEEQFARLEALEQEVPAQIEIVDTTETMPEDAEVNDMSTSAEAETTEGEAAPAEAI